MRNISTLFLLFGSITLFRGEIIPLPPDRSAMVGEWVGFAYQGTEFYRLEIRADGHDLFVRLHPDDSTECYLVNSWGVKPGQLRMPRGMNQAEEPIAIRCLVVDNHYIKMNIRGVGKQWSRHVTLYKQEEWIARLEDTRKAAREARRKRE